MTGLSVTDGCPWRRGDGTRISQCKAFLWSILLIHQKFIHKDTAGFKSGVDPLDAIEHATPSNTGGVMARCIQFVLRSAAQLRQPTGRLTVNTRWEAAVYFRKMVKIDQRQETQRAGIATGRCAGPRFPRRFPKRPQHDQPARWGRFLEPGQDCCPRGPSHTFLEISGNQIIGTFAATNIKPGRSGTNQIPIGIEDVEKAGLIERCIGLNSRQRILGDKKRGFHRAVVSPKSHGAPRWVVGTTMIREINHGTALCFGLLIMMDELAMYFAT